MYKSQAPSQVAKKKERENIENFNSPQGGPRGKRKRPNYHESSDEDDPKEKDSIIQNYSKKLETAGIQKFSYEMKTLDNDKIREAHEDFIKSLLAKPFKMPIAGYTFRNDSKCH